MVEEIRCTEVDVVQQVLVAVALDVLAAGVQVSNGRLQPGVELVLRLVGKTPGMVAVIAAETIQGAGFPGGGILCHVIRHNADVGLQECIIFVAASILLNIQITEGKPMLTD